MAKPRTKAALEAENRILRRYRTSEGIASVFRTAFIWGSLVGIARYGYLSIEALAGQTTMADIGVNVLANIRVSQALAWLLATGGIGYGLAQRKLRRDTVERLQGRIQPLEGAKDSGRSSSRLTARGETRAEDR